MKEYKTTPSEGTHIKGLYCAPSQILFQRAKTSLTTGTSAACFRKDALMCAIPVKCTVIFLTVIHPAAPLYHVILTILGMSWFLLLV